MQAIFSFVRHTISAMVKGFFYTGLVAGFLSLLALFFASPGHHLVMGIAAIFAIVITILAAVLGSAVALIYHLSHLGEARQALDRYTAARRAQRTSPTAKS